MLYESFPELAEREKKGRVNSAHSSTKLCVGDFKVIALRERPQKLLSWILEFVLPTMDEGRCGRDGI